MTMRTATRLGLAAFAFVLLAAAPASAQVDVTFQVDMNPYIASCQFVPAAGNTVTIPGSFNGWNTTATTLADADANGVYTTTLSLAPDSTFFYKFFGTPEAQLGWEADPNRSVTTPASGTLTVPVATPTWAVNNICGAATANYEITFTADMRVQLATGAFTPSTEEVIVAGAVTDWGTNPVVLTEISSEPGVYSATVNADSLVVPGQTPYKFVVRPIGSTDTNTWGWESGSDRQLPLSGTEPDSDADGRREVEARRFFNDVSFEDILNAPATVAFEVDLNPAYYVIADGGTIPIDAAGGGPGLTTITGLFLNGPAANAANEDSSIEDWATWGPGGLGSMPERQLRDDGTNGDLVAGDRIFTVTYNYPAGTARRLVGKLGVDGYDNESAFGNDQNIFLDPGTQRIRYAFGCVRRTDGTYEDNNGPGGPLYDPYLLIDNTLATPTCVVVRTGGVDVANEPGTGPLAGVALGRAFPNPAADAARFTFTVDRAQAVTVTVYDVTGRAVATLVDGAVAAGEHTVTFEAGSLPAGVYVYRLQTAAGALTGRMTVAR